MSAEPRLSEISRALGRAHGAVVLALIKQRVRRSELKRVLEDVGAAQRALTTLLEGAG